MLCILVFFEFLIYIIEWIGYFSDVVVWLFKYKIKYGCLGEVLFEYV